MFISIIINLSKNKTHDNLYKKIITKTRNTNKMKVLFLKINHKKNKNIKQLLIIFSSSLFMYVYLYVSSLLLLNFNFFFQKKKYSSIFSTKHIQRILFFILQNQSFSSYLKFHKFATFSLY